MLAQSNIANVNGRKKLININDQDIRLSRTKPYFLYMRCAPPALLLTHRGASFLISEKEGGFYCSLPFKPFCTTANTIFRKHPLNGMQSTVVNHLFATGAIFVCLASFQPVGHASDQPLQIGMLSSWAWNGVWSQELWHSLLEGCHGDELPSFQILKLPCSKVCLLYTSDAADEE